MIRLEEIARAAVDGEALLVRSLVQDWLAEVGPLDEPLYLVASAATMPRLRRMCELEAPEPLRQRRIYAPADYLVAA